MHFRTDRPIVRVEPGSMHSIDTTNVGNLFGLWSAFSRCAGIMEDGKRLENMSWRLWNREALCCAQGAPDHKGRVPATPRWPFPRHDSSDISLSLPELSTSVDSETSADPRTESRAALRPARPDLRRPAATATGPNPARKHITPVDLEKIVLSIKEKQPLRPLSPLPASVALAAPPAPQTANTTPRPSSPPPIIPDSSTSTVATAVCSDLSEMSPPLGSETSVETENSSHSIVRGFSLGRVSSSLRSKTNLVPTPTANSRPSFHSRIEPAEKKKKGATFTLGGSSGEDCESSLETHMHVARSSLSEGLKKPGMDKKVTAFKDDITTHKIQEKAYEDEEVFESDEEDEMDESESAIEDDDEDEGEWSDVEDSKSSSVNEKEYNFPRIDSRPNLTSRRSLLTTMMHEGDRATALANQAGRPTALRRSRTSTPNGPSLATSPDDGLQMRANNNIPRSRPVIMTTSNTHPPALSPRTTRLNMLQTELTESLRKHLLWERQQKNATSNAALKRRHTAHDMKNLKHYPGEPQPAPLAPVRETARPNNSWNNYFDHGLQEYHEKGW